MRSGNLTKVINYGGRDHVTCVFFGTDECRIHNDSTGDCAHCEVFAAMLNKLNLFETIYEEGDKHEEV